MINSKDLHFALVLMRISFVYLTKITEDSICGYCGVGVIGELAAFVMNRGFQIEFTPSDTNKLNSEFTISI